MHENILIPGHLRTETQLHTDADRRGARRLYIECANKSFGFVSVQIPARASPFFLLAVGQVFPLSVSLSLAHTFGYLLPLQQTSKYKLHIKFVILAQAAGPSGGGRGQFILAEAAGRQTDRQSAACCPVNCSAIAI